MSEQLQRFVRFVVEEPSERDGVTHVHEKLFDAREIETVDNNDNLYRYPIGAVTVTLRSGRLTEDIHVYEPYEQVVSKIQEALR